MENKEKDPLQEEITLEPEPKEETLQIQGGDPLDEIKDVASLRAVVMALPAFSEKHNEELSGIQDIEGVRAFTKKVRAIGNRHKPERVDERKETKIVPEEFVTKKDVATRATRDAKEIAPQEVKDQWDELLKIPLTGLDPLDPKSIVENMKDRLAILNNRKTKKEGGDGATELRETKVLEGTGEGTQGKNKNLSNLKLPRKPESWYPKKK